MKILKDALNDEVNRVVQNKKDALQEFLRGKICKVHGIEPAIDISNEDGNILIRPTSCCSEFTEYLVNEWRAYDHKQ